MLAIATCIGAGDLQWLSRGQGRSHRDCARFAAEAGARVSVGGVF